MFNVVGFSYFWRRTNAYECSPLNALELYELIGLGIISNSIRILRSDKFFTVMQYLSHEYSDKYITLGSSVQRVKIDDSVAEELFCFHTFG